MVVMVIMAILVGLGTSSFMSSQKKSRDAKRKNDLRQISVSLEAYYNDIGHYPLSDGIGVMKGCGAIGANTCTWGEKWSNTSTTPETVYMFILPNEAVTGKTLYYKTDASGTYYALYALLENTRDTGTGVNQAGYAGTNCGGGSLCTYGISSTNTTP